MYLCAGAEALAPAPEANRDKHINFVAEERSEMDPAEESSTGPLSGDMVDKDTNRKKENKKRKKNN
jgi:hypothetical protein